MRVYFDSIMLRSPRLAQFFHEKCQASGSQASTRSYPSSRESLRSLRTKTHPLASNVRQAFRPRLNFVPSLLSKHSLRPFQRPWLLLSLLSMASIRLPHASPIPKNKRPRTTATWAKFIFGDKKSIGPNQLAGGTDYTQARIVSTLGDFLQPDSKTSFNEAAGSILALIPKNAPACAEVYNFGETCVELAEQIPYDHPSHQKFTRLLSYISRSPKFTEVSTLPVSLPWP
jgi:hypothetical protein